MMMMMVMTLKEHFSQSKTEKATAAIIRLEWRAFSSEFLHLQGQQGQPAPPINPPSQTVAYPAPSQNRLGGYFGTICSLIK